MEVLFVVGEDQVLVGLDHRMLVERVSVDDVDKLLDGFFDEDQRD